MQTWLIHIGEDLPVDGGVRKHRYGYLAEALVKAGHSVLRWAPTFHHFSKVQRFAADTRVEIESSYCIQFVHSPGYRRNIGWQRVRTYRALKRRFQVLAERESEPDVIVAAIPSLEWADAAVEYGRARGVPVVVDVRDLWPDVYLNAFPALVRPAGRLLLGPYFRIARRACAGASALAAVSQSYLSWAQRAAERKPHANDFVAPLGFEPEEFPQHLLNEQIARFQSLGIDPLRPICLFAGSFERSYDLDTVIDAARLMESAGRKDVQFVLCGNGSQLASIVRRAAGLRNTYVPGRLNAAQLQALASISVIGLCAYAPDALQSLPNKPFEYLAGGLAVLSSLAGDMAELLERHQCGLTYRAGDARSLARAISELTNDPRRLSDMRANGYAAWIENYRSVEIYSRFVRRLENLRFAVANAA